MRLETQLIHGAGEDEATGSVSIPIYQSSTFRQQRVGQEGGYQYSRGNNPTRHALEQQMATLEGGAGAFAFGSGMAALTAAFSLFAAGDHIIASQNLYGGTSRVLDKIFSRFGITVDYIEMDELAQLKAAIRPNSKAIVIETPSNPTLSVTDIRAAANVAKEHGLLTIADNTFMSPYLQRPLTLGVDLVVHSATKFIGGHSDVLAGIVVAKDPAMAKEIHFIQNSTGAVLGPFDSWLLLRGLKTLGIRLDRQAENAATLANWLRAQPWVKKVYYLGFADHPGHLLHHRQAKNAGNVISFDVGDEELAHKLLSGLQLAVLGDSLGGVESLVNLPDTMSHGSVPAQRKLQMGVTPSLIRLSVGIEHPEDLIADFVQAVGETAEERVKR